MEQLRTNDPQGPAGIVLPDHCPRCNVLACRFLSDAWPGDSPETREYDCGTVVTRTGSVLQGDTCYTDSEARAAGIAR